MWLIFVLASLLYLLNTPRSQVSLWGQLRRSCHRPLPRIVATKWIVVDCIPILQFHLLDFPFIHDAFLFGQWLLWGDFPLLSDWELILLVPRRRLLWHLQVGRHFLFLGLSRRWFILAHQLVHNVIRQIHIFVILIKLHCANPYLLFEFFLLDELLFLLLKFPVYFL